MLILLQYRMVFIRLTSNLDKQIPNQLQLRMKGILLAGGSGTRLHPLTLAVSKQLLPIYDKPMIYYPLSVLMLANIRQMLIISTPRDLGSFYRLLGDGKDFGCEFEYEEQPRPYGIAQAFGIGKKWINGDACALALGDNILWGGNLSSTLDHIGQDHEGAKIFAYQVADPERYGVVKMDKFNTPIDIVEKPSTHVSSWAVPGLYFYDSQVSLLAEQIKPSPRGELEITDLNRLYLAHNQLSVQKLSRGCAWFDAGTHDSLIQAGSFVQTIQTRTGLLVGCPHEVAFRKGWISASQLEQQADRMGKTPLANSLVQLAQGNLA